ncbi:hypothetical protein BJV77DRAFT_957403, partial [Russula vinacea]
FGRNILSRRPIKSLLQLMWLALKDKVLVSFVVDLRLILLALSLFQDFGTTRPEGEPQIDWVKGVNILVAVIIVVRVGSVNDWQKEK